MKEDEKGDNVNDCADWAQSTNHKFQINKIKYKQEPKKAPSKQSK